MPHTRKPNRYSSKARSDRPRYVRTKVAPSSWVEMKAIRPVNAYEDFFNAIPSFFESEHFFTIHCTYILPDRIFALTPMGEISLEKTSALIERIKTSFAEDHSRGEKISGSSLNKIYRVLRKAFELAEDKGLRKMPDISTWKANEEDDEEPEVDALTLLLNDRPAPSKPKYVLPTSPPKRDAKRDKTMIQAIRDKIREGSLFFDFARQCYRYVSEILADGQSAIVIDYATDNPFRAKISLSTLSRDRKYALIA